MKDNILLIKDGGEIVSIVKLKGDFNPVFLEYLSKQVAKDFANYIIDTRIHKDGDYDFNMIYEIISKYEKINTITVIDSYVIDLDEEV